MLDQLIDSGGRLILLGDFNFHVDSPSKPDVIKLMDLMESYNMTQHVKSSTHHLGHMLDLIITRDGEQSAENISVKHGLQSDHYPVHFTLPCGKPPPQSRSISYRKYHQINGEAFQSDILQSALVSSSQHSASSLTALYNEVIEKILNKHAPVRTVTVVDRPRPPWYNNDILCAKQERRAAERRWHSTGLHVHQDIFRRMRCTVNDLIVHAKQDFFHEKLSDCSGNSKMLFKTVDSLLHRKKQTILPSHESAKQLADKFANFFTQKVSRIHNSLVQSQAQMAGTDNPGAEDQPSVCKLSSFAPATKDEILKLIRQSPSTTCSLDPLPTWLLKENLQPLLPVLTELVNMSLASGTVPNTMKQAVITPLLKKASLDPGNLNHFRPVSHLSFISKLTERVVASRLEDHMRRENLYEPLQSAYRRCHSTETALIKITDDLLRAMDKKECILLALLDLSAAFDTVSHDVLLDRLRTHLGVSDVALDWFRSYLEGRTQSVHISGASSPPHDLHFGVPQGSVLGPVLFSIYLAPLANIMRRHGIMFHLYADDSQLYLSFSPPSSAAALARMERCIAEVRIWLARNFLQLNDGKTEILVIGSPFQLPHAQITHLTIGGMAVPVTQSARNLGTLLDSNCTLHSQVTAVCKSAWFHLRSIGRIRKFLDFEATKLVVHALVTSRLDSLNALLYGLPSYDIARVQRVQNAAARVVSRTRKHDHITMVLKSLHWLPVQYRITFKILTLTYKALHGEAPVYISDLLTAYQPGRNLRSAQQYLLVVPRTRTNWGSRAFSVAAPTLWNSLPLLIRQAPTLGSFQRQIKTHLFSLAYNLL